MKKRAANPMRKLPFEAKLLGLPLSPPGDGGADASSPPVSNESDYD